MSLTLKERAKAIDCISRRENQLEMSDSSLLFLEFCHYFHVVLGERCETFQERWDYHFIF